MSLVPWVEKAMADIDRPFLYDDFSHISLRDPFFSPRWDLTSSSWPWRSYYRWLWSPVHHELGGVFCISDNEDGFRARLDVQQFKADELNVKLFGDFVCIEGTHDERSDDQGFIARQFRRRFRLPSDVDKNALNSSLSSDGILELTAPKRAATDLSYRQRSIPIHQTYLPAPKAYEPKKVQFSL